MTGRCFLDGLVGGSDFEKVELSCNHLIILLVVCFSNKTFLIFLLKFFFFFFF